jgi:hypothetical protein
MKKRFIRSIGALIVLATLTACGFQDQGLSTLVPENAFGFVQITDPETFIKNIDAFSAPLGVKDIIGNLEIRDVLNTGLKGSTGLELSSFDLKKPLGLAVLPPVGESPAFGFILYLPLLKPAEDGPKIKALLDASGEVTLSVAKGYAIFTQATGSISFPPAKPMKIPASLEFTPGAITIYGDLKSVLASYQKEWSQLKEQVIAELDSLESVEPTAPDPGTRALTKAMMGGLFGSVEQTKSMAVHIMADATGLRITDTIEFDKDGGISQVLKAIGPGKDIGLLARYMPMGHLMSGAMSGNAAAFGELYQTWISLFLAKSTLPDSDRDAWLKMMSDSIKLMGKNAAFGFDVALNPDLLSMSPDALMANPGEAFSLNLVMAQELTDPEAYQKLLRDTLSGGLMQKYLDAAMAETGFSLKMAIEDRKDGDFAYQALSFDLSVGDPDKLALTSDETRNAATIAASLMREFDTTMSLKGKKLYLAMGDSSLESLKKMVSADQAEKPITQNPIWSSWSKTVPADAQFIGNLSANRIVDMIKLISNNEIAISIPEADQSGINSYALIKEDSIICAASWDIKELAPIAREGINQRPRLLMGAAGGSGPTEDSLNQELGEADEFGFDAQGGDDTFVGDLESGD